MTDAGQGSLRKSARLQSSIVLVWLLAGGFQAAGQIRDQIVVTSHDATTFHPNLRRFDRRLTLLGSTDLVPEAQGAQNELQLEIVIAPDGRIWTPIDPLNTKKLVRMEPDGTLLPSVLLGNYPVSLTASATGVMYALTRVPLQIRAPAYAVDAVGTILWSNDVGPKLYGINPPDVMAVTVDGQLWIGDSTQGVCGCVVNHGLVLRLDTSDGHVLQKVHLAPEPGVQSFFSAMSAAPDGGVWAVVGVSGVFGQEVMRVDETGLVDQIHVLSTNNGSTFELRIDAAGDMWAVSNLAVADGALLRKYSHVTGELLAEIDIVDTVHGFALGAGGEDLIAVTEDVTPPFYRLVRVNLVTKRWSARSLDPFLLTGIGHGDPSGFIYANVIDQAGDSDGDGAPNRVETLAGSSPYDALSRPEGPKVYLDFTANNAIILTFRDPDGLLDPAGGLDVGSISVTAGQYGEVFPILLPFLTFVQVSPDITEATAVFGALPLPAGSKLPLDVRVTDKSGAVGWDWQVTPPGEL
jgi:sugar lactone lactonase YvrE